MMKAFISVLLLTFMWLAPHISMTPAHANTAYAAHTQSDATRILRAFYGARNHAPVWHTHTRFTEQARRFPALTEKLALENGLEPDTYGLDDMKTYMSSPPQNSAEWARAEILWTYNLWLLASDLAGFDYQPDDLAALVNSSLSRTLVGYIPTSPLYQAMQVKLAEINSKLEADPITPAAYVLRPGMHDNAVLPLRALMVELEYLSSPPKNDDEPLTEDETLYDAPLADAIRAFQADHALSADAHIGPQTLEVINNRHHIARIRLVANMQRLRDPMRRAREPRRVEVSIARYHLDAFDNDKPVLSMPVIVGTPRRQTIAFRSEISGVRLNPTWTVPRTIKNEDYIPLLLSEPERLKSRHGIEVIKNGQHIDPTTVNWHEKTPAELASLRMWHPAGSGNPLGAYRVLMDNPYDIYLHDTNAPRLFSRTARALSSGCIRVEDPKALTDYILKEKKGWSPARTQQILATRKTSDVIIENKIPIYLDYMTIWFNYRGQLVFGADIYALDKPRYDGQVNKVLTTQRIRKNLLENASQLMQSSQAN